MLGGTRLCWRRFLGWGCTAETIGSGLWRIKSQTPRNSRCQHVTVKCLQLWFQHTKIPCFDVLFFSVCSLTPSMWGACSLPAIPLVTCATLFGRMSALTPLLCSQVFVCKHKELVNQLKPEKYFLNTYTCILTVSSCGIHNNFILSDPHIVYCSGFVWWQRLMMPSLVLSSGCQGIRCLSVDAGSFLRARLSRCTTIS